MSWQVVSLNRAVWTFGYLDNLHFFPYKVKWNIFPNQDCLHYEMWTQYWIRRNSLVLSMINSPGFLTIHAVPSRGQVLHSAFFFLLKKFIITEVDFFENVNA